MKKNTLYHHKQIVILCTGVPHTKDAKTFTGIVVHSPPGAGEKIGALRNQLGTRPIRALYPHL